MSATAPTVPLAPLAYLVALLVGAGLGILYPLPWFDGVLGGMLFALGWVAMFAALLLWFAARRAMRRAHATLDPAGVPAHLVTSGAFGLSRNPVYLGAATFLVGVGLATGNWWTVLMAFLAGLVVDKLAIEREEKALAERYGKRYRDYARRVRRWV